MNAKERRREDYQNAVEFLCVNLAELNSAISDPGWPPAVDALRSAPPQTDAWYTSIRRLHDIAEDAKIPGGLGLTTPMSTRDWPGQPANRVAGWVCPSRFCTRVVLTDDPGAVPRCDLTERDLRFVEG
jgi:hypothetical protein